MADEEITARFDDLTWTAAPGALSAASFERAEVYRVIEARGPVFPKSIADELGMPLRAGPTRSLLRWRSRSVRPCAWRWSGNTWLQRPQERMSSP